MLLLFTAFLETIFVGFSRFVVIPTKAESHKLLMFRECFDSSLNLDLVHYNY